MVLLESARRQVAGMGVKAHPGVKFEATRALGRGVRVLNALASCHLRRNFDSKVGHRAHLPLS
jgi:hypothetical protein